jgi:hypothetical protein
MSSATGTCRCPTWSTASNGCADNLATIGELVGNDDLDRVGRHPELGEVTMCQLLATWAVHDLDHVAQMYAGLAGTYDQAVGPWKAYHGILLRRDRSATG